MIAVYGMRSLFTSIHCLRLYPYLSQKISSGTFNGANNLHSLSWPLLRIPKATRKVNNLYLTNRSTTYYSTEPSHPSRDDIQLNKKIISLKTVEDQLELFDSFKNSASIVNRVTMLHRIAKITKRDEKQKEILKMGQNSPYVELLENVTGVISECQTRDLANLMWALGKIKEKEHKLVEVCEKEILSRGIMAFNNAHIYQIMNGCANLNLRKSGIFGNVQEAILNGQLKIEDFDDRGLCIMMLSFLKTENGSLKMFNVVLREILSRDLSRVDIHNLAQFVWAFAMMEFQADELFDRTEAVILKHETADFHNINIIQMLFAFATAEKGSEELFYVLDNELVVRGVKRFNNFGLFRIVWSFAKRDMTKVKVFDLVKKEVLDRGLCKFQAHQLVMILWSFVSAERHDDILVSEIDRELCLRDHKQLSNANLCQVAWSLGRAGWSDSKLYNVIEAEVFQRGPSEFTAKEKRMLMRGFLEAKNGSEDFFKLLLGSFSTNDCSNLTCAAICDFAWCLSKANVEAGTLFVALECEILSKDKSYFTERELEYIKLNFKEAGKGSKALFELKA